MDKKESLSKRIKNSKGAQRAKKLTAAAIIAGTLLMSAGFTACEQKLNMSNEELASAIVNAIQEQKEGFELSDISFGYFANDNIYIMVIVNSDFSEYVGYEISKTDFNKLIESAKEKNSEYIFISPNGDAFVITKGGINDENLKDLNEKIYSTVLRGKTVDISKYIQIGGQDSQSQTELTEEIMETLSEWPQNQFTADIPAFDFGKDSVISQIRADMVDTYGYSILISNVTEEQYTAYIDVLKVAGYLFDRNYHIDESYSSPLFKEGHCCELGKGTTAVSIFYSADGSLESQLQISIRHDVHDMYLVDLADQSGWPENEATAQIVAPDFAADLPIQAGFGTKDGKNVYCIKISGLSEEQYHQYVYGQLEGSGFVRASGSIIHPTCGTSWYGKKETDNGTIECLVFFGPEMSYFEVLEIEVEFDTTPYIYINIMLPTE